MNLYSIKMRASKDGKHISGAENIVSEPNIDAALSTLVKRALEHTKGSSDFINFKIEKVNNVKYLEPLKVRTINVKSKEEGLKGIIKILELSGISEKTAKVAVEILCNIKDMRGAVILDINTLKRLEKDQSRGVRVTYMDLENRNIGSIEKSKATNTHFIEALVLATKVMDCPSIVAEICYSDDPNYTAGYVATKIFGYTRFDYLKDYNIPYGGRVFLYDSTKGSLEECIDYLENERVIVKYNVKVLDDISVHTLLSDNFNYEELL